MKSCRIVLVASLLLGFAGTQARATDNNYPNDSRGPTPSDKFNADGFSPGYVHVHNDPTGFNRNVIRHYVYNVPVVVPGSPYPSDGKSTASTAKAAQSSKAAATKPVH